VGLLALGSRGFRSVALELGGELLVGRHHSCQLSLPDRALSRYHARFSRRADRVVVEDLGSRYGTWLDGKRVAFAELRVGASVRLGDVVVAVTPGLSSAGSAQASDALEPAPDARHLDRPMREVQALLQYAARANSPIVVVDSAAMARMMTENSPAKVSARRSAPARVSVRRTTQEPAQTSSAPAQRMTLRARLAVVERTEMEKALAESCGNQRLAAELLGIPLRTFERRWRARRRPA
jgi:pSer/pThr/pTyr-binding forkhead associated (FHA) protein